MQLETQLHISRQHWTACCGKHSNCVLYSLQWCLTLASLHDVWALNQFCLMLASNTIKSSSDLFPRSNCCYCKWRHTTELPSWTWFHLLFLFVCFRGYKFCFAKNKNGSSLVRYLQQESEIVKLKSDLFFLDWLIPLFLYLKVQEHCCLPGDSYNNLDALQTWKTVFFFWSLLNDTIGICTLLNIGVCCISLLYWPCSQKLLI